MPIVRYEIGSLADLKAGAAFTVSAATKKPDGRLKAARINVGRDGPVPVVSNLSGMNLAAAREEPSPAFSAARCKFRHRLIKRAKTH